MKARSHVKISSVLILLSILSATTLAEPLKAFQLKSFQSEQTEQLIKFNELATIAMVYQPDCSWCKKQGLLLAKVQQACKKHINLALVGHKGSARKLKRELKHFSKDIPAYLADKQFLRVVGGVKASPTTLFFDKNGKVLAKKRGYIPQKKLVQALDVLTEKSCQI